MCVSGQQHCYRREHLELTSVPFRKGEPVKKSAASLFLIAIAILISSCGGGADAPPTPVSTGAPSGAPTQTSPAKPPLTVYVVTYGGSKLHAFHLDDNDGLTAFPNSPFFAIGSPWTAVVTPKKAGLLLTHFSGHQSIAHVALEPDGVPGAITDHVLPDDAFVGNALLFHPNGKFLYALSYAEPAIRIFAVNGEGIYTEDVSAKYSLGNDCPDAGSYYQQAVGTTPDGSLVITTKCLNAITVLTTDPESGHILGRTDKLMISLGVPTAIEDYVMSTGQAVGDSKSQTKLWQVRDGQLVELAACDCSVLQAAVAPNGMGGFGVEGDGTVVTFVRDGAMLNRKPSSVVITSPYFKGMHVTDDGRFLIVLSDTLYGSGYFNVLQIGNNGALGHVNGSPVQTGWLSTSAVEIAK